MSRVEVVAELGINMNGSLDTAYRMIDAAQEVGADVVKFQASFPRLETSYHIAPDHMRMIEASILTHDQLEKAAAHCDDRGIEFICTPAEEQSLAWLVDLPQTRRIKVGSDNLTNDPFLRAVESTRLPVILSTGMANGETVREAVRGFASRDITLLHCVSSYPCPVNELNLRAIDNMSWSEGCEIGLSDHTTSLVIPAVAVGLGAVMIEKHFTLDRSLPGPDHKASLEPHQFRIMVDNIRETEAALGDGVKRVMPSEVETAKLVRKGIKARTSIKAGERFSAVNLIIARPAVGSVPACWSTLLGAVADRDYTEGDAIGG